MIYRSDQVITHNSIVNFAEVISPEGVGQDVLSL